EAFANALRGYAAMLQPAASAEPVAWAAVHFGGRRDGKIYTTCDTQEQIEAYIQAVHRSSDSLTLHARPLAFADAPVAAQDPAKGADVALRHNWNEHLIEHNAPEYQHDFMLFKVVEAYVLKHLADRQQRKGGDQ